ncbi:MAG: hypothetical protein Q4B54_08295, partial [Coriobacteriales bacterium]|nr:hypothetical protein [Coriobacteriales bacterium]
MPADQTQPPPVNRNHKDTIFRDLFGTEQNKANTLSLFNALSGTNYEDPDILAFTTLDNVLYMSVKNDVSFLINFEMILWEHQSSYNPNMPLRGLSYFARLYASWIERNNKSVYAETIIELPTPTYFVFYIGEKKRPDKEILRLSDAFGTNKGSVEVTVTVLNINKGHNPELMAACKTLSDYASFIARIREYNKSMKLPEAVDAAVDYCIEHGILSDYLRDKKEKVRDMFLTEYDQAKTMRQ